MQNSMFFFYVLHTCMYPLWLVCSQESQYCIKLYNKLALALATFENLYMSQWRTSVNSATKALQATLLKVPFYILICTLC